MRTIAIVNQKGGCGKTTTSINLASVFAHQGKRTLLIDLDPQAHCAAGLGVPESQIEQSISDALLAEEEDSFDSNDILWEVARNFYLAPSTMRLAALEAPGGGLHQLADKDRRLERVLSSLHHRFDVCLIDCPPTIGLLTFNALRAAREVLIPVETGFFSLRGAEKQWQTIQRTVNHLGRPIACHLLPTLHDPNSKTAREVLAALHRQFAGQIVPVVIHEHEALREATTLGQAVVEYSPESDACRDFEQLAAWLEEHAVRPTMDIEVLHQGPPYIASPTQPAPVRFDGGRAGELVQRVRDIAQRAEQLQPYASQFDTSETDVSKLYGARVTGQGVLFVQPGEAGMRISIAGDFNNWSTTAHIMRFNPDVRVHEALIQLPPGQYQYRIVVDGTWRADPYNAHFVADSHGRTNSVIDVEELRVPL